MFCFTKQYLSKNTLEALFSLILETADEKVDFLFLDFKIWNLIAKNGKKEKQKYFVRKFFIPNTVKKSKGKETQTDEQKRLERDRLRKRIQRANLFEKEQ